MVRKAARITILSALGILIAGFIFYGLLESTSKPGFCSSCHYMEPYVEAWKSSSHSDVTCTDCHFPPGIKSMIHGKFTAISMVVNYFTGVYKKSKPWAEISDSSCLRSGCHTKRLLDGQVAFKEGIIFDHKPHLSNLRRGKKLRCTSCHSQIVQGEHISVTETTCFLCHFKNQPDETPINGCTGCHDLTAAAENGAVIHDHSFAEAKNIDCRKCHGNMQVGDGAVPKERCSSCHAEIGHLEKISDIDFMHLQHVTDHKIECENCHSVIQHKSIAHTNEIFPECQTCHSNTHKAQLTLFKGIGGRDVPAHPNPMYISGLNCRACHVYHRIGKEDGVFGDTEVANREVCEDCHGQGYGKLLDKWKMVMEQKVNQVDRLISSAKTDVDVFSGSVEKKINAKKFVEDAAYNFNLVKQANIVHNVAYADELLASAYNKIKAAIVIIDSDLQLPDISIYSKQVPSECKNCHYGQEEFSVSAFGTNFSHNTHIVNQKLPCTKCHSNVQTHGETIITKNECLTCHHTQEIIDCEKCHELQASIYSGNISFISESSEGVMYGEGIECRDCHAGGDAQIRKANPETCINCHDEEYGDILINWKKDTAELMQSLDEKIFQLQKQGLTENNLTIVLNLKTNLELLKEDKSLGVHNFELINKILKNYLNLLNDF